MNCLKNILQDQGRTQKWLANQLNRSQNTISSWCTNHTQPSVDDLFLIAGVLGINPKDLLKDNNKLKNN